MSIDEHPKIKKCPFCGSTGAVFKGGFGELAVCCTSENCGAGHDGRIWFRDEVNAIKKWNERFPERAVMRIIYLITGFTGEHDDYNEWPVIAYDTKSDAEAHAERSRKWMEERLAALGFDTWLLAWSAHNFDLRTQIGHNPYDPEMKLDYTGTDWKITEIPYTGD